MLPTARRRYTVPLPGGRSLVLGTRTRVMGVLNVTPDSFSDGGRHADPPHAVDAALAMIAAGADLIDVGGESTRPGATPVDADDEIRRAVPVIAALTRQTDVPISVDTTKPAVARAALDAGAALVNDISGLRHDPSLAQVAAGHGAALVLMHMRGTPADMYDRADYADVCAEVADELAWSVARALDAGVGRASLILDPGIGFAKRAAHSWTLLRQLGHPALVALDLPWLVGVSRKSFLQTAVGNLSPPARDPASLAAAVVAILGGAHLIRVHDVAGSVQASRVADMISAADTDVS
ncbi:MAG: dihydropteroate synthase [Acidobacteria bacterium]|nr:dihydropteroate synthase [Acidobacteriota bacterium]